MQSTLTQKAKNPLKGFDERSGPDRRHNRRIFTKYHFKNGRRKAVRREQDRSKVFVPDQWGSSVFIVILSILILSLLDAVFTLFLLDHGAVELNPVMTYFIEKGPQVFISVKYLITSVAVLILLLFKDAVSQKHYLVAHSFTWAAMMFGIVIVWELYLISQVTG